MMSGMREIKFRGKDITTRGWRHGYLVQYVQLGNTRSCIYGETWDYSVYESTVGQYTGAKDKDGAEIYEGDLLEYKDAFGTRVGVVLWDEKMCTYAVEFKSTGTRLYCWTDIYMTAIVCGNIHDNPELLEEN